MTDTAPSSGDQGGIQPQVVQYTGIDNFIQSEIRLNLKLSPAPVPNQEGEQHPGQTIHFTVQHGTCQLILPRQLASDLLLNLKIPETLSLNFGQSSAPEPQMSTVQPPESLPRNLPLTDTLLDIMKQSKKAIDKTKKLLQNRSDRFVKVEEDLAMLKSAFFSSIGLENNDNRISDNVAQKSTSIPNLEVPLMVKVTTEREQRVKDHEEGIEAKQQDNVDLITAKVGRSDASLVSFFAVDLPGTTSQADEAAESEDPTPASSSGPIRSDPQPSTSQGTSGENSTFPFPSLRLAGTDHKELGTINVMIRKILTFINDMVFQKNINSARAYGTEDLDNVFYFSRTNNSEKSSKQKQQLQEFLEKRASQFKNTNPLYFFYQALLEVFTFYDNKRIADLPCYLESKKNKEAVLKNFEQKILPELDAFCERHFNDSINKYIEVQGRRYDGKPPQPGDEKIKDWRKIFETKPAYQYLPDSPSYKTQELFRSAKRRHEEDAWKSEEEGYYNLFYSVLAKNPKNEQVINSDFAFFTIFKKCFPDIERIYFFSFFKGPGCN